MIMTMEDIRLEGRAGRLGAVMTAVVVEGKEWERSTAYRTEHERVASEVTEEKLQDLYADIPFGLPEEPTPKAGRGASRAFSVDGYGIDTWRKLVHESADIATLSGFAKSIIESSQKFGRPSINKMMIILCLQ